MIGGRRSLQGRKPGDRRVRIDRPHAAYFRYAGEGTMTAKEAAGIPTTPGTRMIAYIRAFILGRPLHQDVLDQAWPPDTEAPITIVVLPEFVARHWWDRLLYNSTAKRLKVALVGREHTVIADVPYRRRH